MDIQNNINKRLGVFLIQFYVICLLQRCCFTSLNLAILCNLFCVIQVRKHRNIQDEGLFENIMLRMKFQQNIWRIMSNLRIGVFSECLSDNVFRKQFLKKISHIFKSTFIKKYKNIYDIGYNMDKRLGCLLFSFMSDVCGNDFILFF